MTTQLICSLKLYFFFDHLYVAILIDSVYYPHRSVYSPFSQTLYSFVAGVILRERLPAFERMLWRACRGNVFLRQAVIESALEDPSNVSYPLPLVRRSLNSSIALYMFQGDNVFKSVFIIFFQGDQLKTRVKKICEGFRATLYPCPEAPSDRREMAMGVMTRIEDLNTVLGQTQDHRHRVLVAAAKNLKNWFVKVRKIKAIYHTLNLFNLDVTQKCLIAECWVPVLDIETIQLALRRGTVRNAYGFELKCYLSWILFFFFFRNVLGRLCRPFLIECKRSRIRPPIIERINLRRRSRR